MKQSDIEVVRPTTNPHANEPIHRFSSTLSSSNFSVRLSISVLSIQWLAKVFNPLERHHHFLVYKRSFILLSILNWNIPTAWCYHCHISRLRWCFLRHWYHIAPRNALRIVQNVLFWPHMIIQTFSHITSNIHTCLNVALLKQIDSESPVVWIALKLVYSTHAPPFQPLNSRCFGTHDGWTVNIFQSLPHWSIWITSSL